DSENGVEVDPPYADLDSEVNPEFRIRNLRVSSTVQPLLRAMIHTHRLSPVPARNYQEHTAFSPAELGQKLRGAIVLAFFTITHKINPDSKNNKTSHFICILNELIVLRPPQDSINLVPSHIRNHQLFSSSEQGGALPEDLIFTEDTKATSSTVLDHTPGAGPSGTSAAVISTDEPTQDEPTQDEPTEEAADQSNANDNGDSSDATTSTKTSKSGAVTRPPNVLKISEFILNFGLMYAHSAFKREYIDETHTLLIDTLHEERKLRTGAVSAKRPYNWSFLVAQSSGMGKSRMVEEAGSLAFTIPINLCEDPSPGATGIRQYFELCRGRTDKEQRAAYAVLLRALFETAGKPAKKRFPGQTRADLALAWADYLKEGRSDMAVGMSKENYLHAVVAEVTSNRAGPDKGRTRRELIKSLQNSCRTFISVISPNRPYDANACFVHFDEAQALTQADEANMPVVGGTSAGGS
ncbi:hypothetical protein FRC07_012213, partial [Ceratobasidium sp. 392]